MIKIKLQTERTDNVLISVSIIADMSLDRTRLTNVHTTTEIVAINIPERIGRDNCIQVIDKTLIVMTLIMNNRNI